MSEHPTSADRRQLLGVSDAHQAPPVRRCESHELVEVVGRGHAGLVEDHGRPGRHSPATTGVRQEPGQGHRGAAGLSSQHVGRLAGRGDADHGPTGSLEVVDAGRQGRGLAGTGRSDDQCERRAASDGAHSCLHGISIVLGGRCADRFAGPGEELCLLLPDGARGEVPVGHRLRDRAAVRAARVSGRSGRVELEAAIDRVSGQGVDHRRQLEGGVGR